MTLSYFDTATIQDYRITLFHKDEEQYYEIMGKTHNIVQELSIKEDIDTPIIELSMKTSFVAQENFFSNGDVLFIYMPILDFRGNIIQRLKYKFTIFKVFESDDDSTIHITGRNDGHWLKRELVFLKVTNRDTASSFIRRTAEENGIKILSIDTMVHQLKAKVFQSSSLYDAWLSTMTTTMIHDGINLRLSMTPLGLKIEQIHEHDESRWMFEQSKGFSNVFELSRIRSILDPQFTNVVVGTRLVDQSASIGAIIGAGTAASITRTNEVSVNKYGAHHSYVDLNAYATDEEAITALDHLIENGDAVESISFITPAINTLQPLDQFYIKTHKLGSGLYYIDNIETFLRHNIWSHKIMGTKKRNVPQNILRESDENSDPTGLSNILGG